MPVNTVGPPYSDTMKFVQTVSDYTRLSSESRSVVSLQLLIGNIRESHVATGLQKACRCRPWKCGSKHSLHVRSVTLMVTLRWD